MMSKAQEKPSFKLKTKHETSKKRCFKSKAKHEAPKKPGSCTHDFMVFDVRADIMGPVVFLGFEGTRRGALGNGF